MRNPHRERNIALWFFASGWVAALAPFLCPVQRRLTGSELVFLSMGAWPSSSVAGRRCFDIFDACVKEKLARGGRYYRALASGSGGVAHVCRGGSRMESGTRRAFQRTFSPPHGARGGHRGDCGQECGADWRKHPPTNGRCAGGNERDPSLTPPRSDRVAVVLSGRGRPSVWRPARAEPLGVAISGRDGRLESGCLRGFPLPWRLTPKADFFHGKGDGTYWRT